jgi:hypothetical protein
MADLQCKLEIPKIEGLKDQELTVGREFFLSCDGEVPKTINRDKVHFVLKPENKYQLQLLGFEFRTSSVVDLKVTSYLAGQHHVEGVQLTDGEFTVALAPVDFTVQTVLEPPAAPTQPGEQPAKQEPYGPIGPAVIGIPLVYWASFLAVLSVMGLFAAFRFYRIAQRRRMLERLRQHDSALSPIAEFHQNMRRLARENTVFFGGEGTAEDVHRSLDEGHRVLKLYLTRKYRIPAMEWSDRLILNDIRKYHGKAYDEHGSDLKKILKEYSRAFHDKKHLKTNDVLNLTKFNRKLVEQLERVS